MFKGQNRNSQLYEDENINEDEQNYNETVGISNLVNTRIPFSNKNNSLQFKIDQLQNQLEVFKNQNQSYQHIIESQKQQIV